MLAGRLGHKGKGRHACSCTAAQDYGGPPMSDILGLEHKQQCVLHALRTTLVLPAPTVEAMPAADGMAELGASSEKKPKNTKGAEEPPANMVAPACGQSV